jgi:hypothetical protein
MQSIAPYSLNGPPALAYVLGDALHRPLFF